MYICTMLNLNKIIMKLELKHLVPYLTCDLNCYLNKYKTSFRLKGISTDLAVQGFKLSLTCGTYNPIEVKPILRPLSDLTKKIEVNGEKFVPINYFLGDDGDSIMNAYYSDKHLETIPYNLLMYLFEWHFDVFGLIEKGLAIDINTLNK